MESIGFTARLNASDWEADKQAWRCPALDIPGATIREIFSSGERIDKSWYEILSAPAMIHWIKDNPPLQIAVSISLSENLSLNSDKDFWKKLTVIVPIISAIIAALATYYSSAKPPLAPPVISSVRFAQEPADSAPLPPPILTIDGKTINMPVEYGIAKNTAVSFDVGNAAGAYRSLQSANYFQKRVLDGILDMVDGTVQGLKQVTAIASSNGCPGGAGGIAIPNAGMMVARVETAVVNLQNAKSAILAIPK